MAVTITITVEGHFSMLAAPFEAEEGPEQPLESPTPAIPAEAWGSETMAAGKSWEAAQLGSLQLQCWGRS